jgi:dihydroorotate dehydrogenase
VLYSLARTALFQLDPELAHDLALKSLAALGPAAAWLGAGADAGEAKRVMGIDFPNPVGLAAGLDKNGAYIDALAALGFGFLEIGTVTPRPQPGNPKPRVFRLVEDGAVINRMGFPGRGAEYVARQLAGRRPRSVVLGVNLGKNKDTPLEEAAADYVSLMGRFMPLVDYLAINVSSPNTVGLRRLQGRDMLEGLLKEVGKEREAIAQGRGGCKPVLVKLAPDLSDGELDDALDAILRTGMDGVIATNTTLGRAGLRSVRREEAGGLSGEPLRGRSEAVLHQVVKRLDGRLPVVSAGGIMRPEDAKTRLEAGAVLVQLYTGLVYAGPGLVQKIIRAV